MNDDLNQLLEFNRTRLHALVATRNNHLDLWLKQLKKEEEVAAQLFYTHLLGKSSDQLPGFSRYLIHQADFSGDLVLAKRAPDGRIFCLLADATGHGLSAALTLMPVASQFRAQVEAGGQLAPLVKTINRELNEQLPGDRFVAAILIEINPQQGYLRLWNGGMPPLLVLNNQGQLLQTHVSKNLALGILDPDSFEPCFCELQLPTQGQLFAATDGLMELLNPAGETFAKQQLLDCLSSRGSHPLLDSLLSAVYRHCGQRRDQLDDDLSIMHLDLACILAEQKTQGLNASLQPFFQPALPLTN